MRIEEFSFSEIRIDGATHEYGLVIDRGEVSKRKKKASKKNRAAFGHTPTGVPHHRIRCFFFITFLLLAVADKAR